VDHNTSLVNLALQPRSMSAVNRILNQREKKLAVRSN
jgi:hypothetical protein